MGWKCPDWGRPTAVGISKPVSSTSQKAPGVVGTVMSAADVTLEGLVGVCDTDGPWRVHLLIENGRSGRARGALEQAGVEAVNERKALVATVVCGAGPVDRWASARALHGSLCDCGPVLRRDLDSVVVRVADVGRVVSPTSTESRGRVSIPG